jgi:hypothetical protein
VVFVVDKVAVERDFLSELCCFPLPIILQAMLRTLLLSGAGTVVGEGRVYRPLGNQVEY